MNAERAVEQYAHGPPAIRVTFGDPDEFVQEIKERGPNVEPVVRATLRWTPDASGAPFHHLSLVVTYLRRLPDGVLTLAELRYDIGPVWSGLDHAESRLHRERARQTLAMIDEATRAAGATPARGVYRYEHGPGALTGDQSRQQPRDADWARPLPQPSAEPA